jgi:hypothetical protein
LAPPKLIVVPEAETLNGGTGTPIELFAGEKLQPLPSIIVVSGQYDTLVI